MEKENRTQLDELRFYQDAMHLWDNCWNDVDVLIKDVWGREVAKQLTRSVGSISANIEEGYGRGFGKEYPHFLRIARGSAQESKGWYRRSKFILPKDVIEKRIAAIDGIIARITKTISTLERKKR